VRASPANLPRFCIDINSPRTLQTATEKLFKAVSEYAHDVPIVVVATKKDDFCDINFSARRKEMKKQGLRFDEGDKFPVGRS
jgi:GTPase SAR1 family protein